MTRRSQPELILNTTNSRIDLIVDQQELRARFFQKVHEIISERADKAQYSHLLQRPKRDMPAMYKIYFFQGEFKWHNNAIMMDAKSGMPVFNSIHASHPWWYDRQRLEL